MVVAVILAMWLVVSVATSMVAGRWLRDTARSAALVPAVGPSRPGPSGDTPLAQVIPLDVARRRKAVVGVRAVK